MSKKNIITILVVAMITTLSATVMETLANEVKNNQSSEENVHQYDSTKTNTTKFDLYNNDKFDVYNEVFQMKNSNIKSITNNGGQYGNSNIHKAIDGDLNTHWETGKPNSDNFTNEVNLTFHEVVNLNRVVYAARQDSAKGKGFANQFEIYASLTEGGNDFTLVSSGKYMDSAQDLVEIKFPSTDFKRLKFKFLKANQNWASASEFMFYKEDAMRDKVKTLFTDGTMSVVSEEYNSAEKIDQFEETLKDHPLFEDFKKLTDLARSLISNPKQDEVFALEMRGDSIEETVKRKMWRFQDLQVTGRSARPGEKINVYVDVAPGEPTPVLLYKQAMTQHGGSIHIQLHHGKNEITIPEVDYQENGIPQDIIQGGELFFTNYKSDYQTRAPRVRIEGASYYPVFILGKSDEVEVMRELEEYVAKMEAEPDTTPNIFAVSSNKTLSLVQASYALDWYKNHQKTPKHTAESWDAYIHDAMTFWGFDNSQEIHSDYDFRIMPMVKNLTGNAFMNAANGVIGVRPGNQDTILNANKGWGMAHELGHNFDTNGRTIGEVANNMMSLFFESHHKTSTRITEQNLWENKIYPKVGLDDYSNNTLYDTSDSTSLTQLAPLWQLYLYDNTYYGRFEQQFREKDFGNKNREDIYRSWVIAASDAMQLDLTEFFARHGIRVDDNVKESLAKYQKPDKKIYYLNDLAMNYNGNGFNEQAEVSVTTGEANGKVRLSFQIDDENKNHILGYEIRRDGIFIGFTALDSFVDTNVSIGEDAIYVITPYDRKLNPLKEIEVDSNQPHISVNPVITLGLGEEFNAKDYLYARDKDGNSLVSDTIVIANNVDTSKPGEYEVIYQFIDIDRKEYIARAKVNVVTRKESVSDLSPSIAKNGWGIVQKDKSISGGVLGLSRNGIHVDYEKGLGLHANAEYVYDLEGVDYDFFESYIGVDKEMSTSTASSVIFKVFVDGEEKFNSGIMKSSTSQKYVKVDIKDAKELKLVVNDAGNGNSADHASWGDAKLATFSTKPVIKGEDLVYNVKETVDLKKGIVSKSVFGEELSQDFIIKSSNYVEGQTGIFTIVYSVIDSNGESAELTRNIIVTETETQLSDLDWKSATIGSGSIKKDKAVSGNPLRLLNDRNQVEIFDKGIGTHAHSEIVYHSDGYDVFDTWVGVDQEVAGQNSSVQFKVYVDGVLKAQSGVMRAYMPKQHLFVDIRGSKEIKLVVEEAENNNLWDHANWGNARLHKFSSHGDDYSEKSIDIHEESKEVEEGLENNKETEDIFSNNERDTSDIVKDVFNQEENELIEETDKNTLDERIPLIQEQSNKSPILRLENITLLRKRLTDEIR